MNRGFTLIQISILLIAASLVLVAILPSTRTNLNANNATTAKLNSILTVMRGYEASHAALPCPADASQPIGSTSYGVAAANPGTGSPGNCTGGTPAANYVDTANNVAVGMVPVRALGLSNDYALDSYGRDITYAVDTNATVCFSGSLPGKITVTDSGTPSSTIASLVSHGPDGHGAWIPLTGSSGTAVRLNAGATDTNELLNAHVNSSFVATTPLTNFVRSPPTATFDDLLVYRSSLWTLNAAPASSAPLLASVTPPANGTYITGQTLTFLVTYGSNVTVTGTPQLALTIPKQGGGSNTRYASYVSTSGNTASFSYTVQATDSAPTAPTGVAISSPIGLNGGTITVGGGAACLSFTPPSLTGIILNPGANMYVTDTNNNRVEEFNSSGAFVMGIGAGYNGVSGSIGSSGTGSGQFNQPTGVAVDTSGNIWVVDGGNNRVEEFSSSGAFVMGIGAGYNGVSGSIGSSGTGSGQFNQPTGVAVDTSGNIWVVDYSNHRVEEFSSGGSFIKGIGDGYNGVSGSIGSCGGGNGQLCYPASIAIDASGNAWVVDGNNRVEEFSSSGSFIKGIGSGYNGVSGVIGTPGSGNGQFHQPTGIAIDGSGNIWVADQFNDRTEEFSSSGAYVSQLGCASGACFGSAGNGQFNSPDGVAVDGSGHLYVVDNGNNRVEEFNSCGLFLSGIGAGYNGVSGSIGSSGTGSGQFSNPEYIIFSGAVCSTGACITSVTPPSNGAYSTGQTLTFTVTYDAAVTVTGTPQLVLTIGSNTRYANYLSGGGTTTLTFTYTIQSSDTASGIALASSINLNGGTITSGGTAAALTYIPPSMSGIIINTTSFMLVADLGNNRVQALTLSGAVIDQFPCVSGACTASSSNGKFDIGAYYVAVDGSGNIWTTDYGNNRVEKFNSSDTWIKSIGGPSPFTCETSPAGSVPACAAGSGNGQFNGLFGLNIDSNGNIWVADIFNYRVEKFNSSGVYQSQLGTTGTSGCTAGLFSDPEYIHFDSSGNLYVSDYNCSQLEEFNSSGTYVKTFGPTIPGYGRTFSSLTDFAFDACGDMWIGDSGNNNVVALDYEGNYVSSFSDAGTSVQSIAIDSSGNIYVLGIYSTVVSVYNSSGVLQNSFGAFNEPSAVTIVGSSPTRLPISSCPAVILSAAGPANGTYTTAGTLGFAVTYDQAVTVTGTPQISVTIGNNTRQASYISGSGTATLTFQYTAVAGDSSYGISMNAPIGLNGGTISSNGINSRLYFSPPNLSAVNVNPATCTSPCIYVTDSGNNRAEKFDMNGNYVGQFGSFGTGNGQFSSPEGIALDSSGNIYVVDQLNNRVEKFNSSFVYQSQFGTSGSGNGQFNQPGFIAINGSGNIWVTDTVNNRVEKFTSAGAFSSKFGTNGTGNGQFNSPGSIAIDGSGNIWVTDTFNCRVEKFTSAGVFSSKFGSCGSGNGQFSSPEGIAVDASGNIWVTDSNQCRVQKFTSAGVYSSQFGSNGSGNGQFQDPQGIAIDGSGNIWVTDATRVQKFNSSGVYQSQFGSSGTGNGQFNLPVAIAIH